MESQRKVVVFTAVSLDGYIAKEDDWLFPAESKEEQAAYAEIGCKNFQFHLK